MKHLCKAPSHQILANTASTPTRKNVKDYVDSQNSFKAGETYSFSGTYIDCPGHVTSSGTLLVFSVVLPKEVGSLTPTLNSMEAEFRTYDGYLAKTGSGWHSVFDYTSNISPEKAGTVVLFRCVLPSGTWDTNNIVAVVSLRSISITFS